MRAAMRTVSRGIVPTGKSGSGGASASDSPLTPSRFHAARALVGPRSAPPCFFEPPTSVGAMSSAPAAHSAAPGQPREAIRSTSTSPTDAPGVVVEGHAKKGARCFFTATRMNRGRNCGTPKSRAFTMLVSTQYPSPSKREIRARRYATNRREAKPATFSSNTPLGSRCSTRRNAAGKRSRSSSLPSCFPATEKGGQGTPPATRSTPRNPCGSSVRTSASKTGQAGRFFRSVAQA